MKKILIVALLGITITSCKVLEDAMKAAADLNLGLTDTEISQGLKEALKVGLRSSVSSASGVDGYLKNEAIKLLLPPEIKELKSKIDNGSVSLLKGAVKVPYTKILDTYVELNPNIRQDPFDELLIAMNRGAESAASKATPIFTNALLSMSITDALKILQGNDRAATDYFYGKTKASLTSAFQPEVRAALEKTKALDIYESTANFVNYEYKVDYLLSTYTVSVNDYIGVTLPENIDGYATEKAIDGLFKLIGDEEQKIRANPLNYASAIIKKVFNSDEAKGNS